MCWIRFKNLLKKNPYIIILQIKNQRKIGIVQSAGEELQQKQEWLQALNMLSAQIPATSTLTSNDRRARATQN